MADLPPLYPADPGSPFTTLAEPYTTGDTTVTLTDASTRPAAPNLLCLEGAPGSGVLLYTGIDGNTLTGVSQIEGPTGTWPAGSYAYRGFTAGGSRSAPGRGTGLHHLPQRICMGGAEP